MSQPVTTVDPKAQAAETERQMVQMCVELNSKFGRLIRGMKAPKEGRFQAPWISATKMLAITSPNSRGTDRFNLEVDFAYLQDEFYRGPSYLKPKLIDKMSGIIANVITKLKEQREESATPEAAS